jgi:hypothetical protein
MKILCRYTLDDYLEAHRLHRKGSIWRQWERVVGFLFLFICIGAGLLIVLPTPRLYRTALPLLGLAVFWVLLLFVFPRMRIQYVFKRNPYLNQESTVEVSEEGILTENPNMRSQRNWNMFIRWAENERLFMVYSAPNQFLLLPKRSLAAGEADQLRDLLGRKLPGK